MRIFKYLLFVACFLVFGISLTLAAPYPLKMSTNKRYLVDQNNSPFLLVGDSAQAMVGAISETDAATYFSNRQAAGVNAVWIHILCGQSYPGCKSDNSGLTYDGIAPFTTAGDLSTPNSAYFTRVDHIVSLAAQYGMTVFLSPAETINWLPLLRSNGTTKAFNYGVYLGNRYKNMPNIVWIHGNDFQTWATASDDTLVQAVANGIKSVDTNHLQTVELDYPTSASLNDSSWGQYIGLDLAYSYYSTYDQVLREYNRPNFIPTYFHEGVYEDQDYMGGYTGPHQLRAQEYWTQLSGAAGNFFGNRYIFRFETGWKNHLSTTGLTEFGYWRNFFATRPWFNLVPDQNHTVLTAGYGTYQAISSAVIGNTSDYVTTARTADGALVVSYLPTARTITIDMTKLVGTITARWFDPTTANYTTIGNFANTGTRQFTPPTGNHTDLTNDWVLVLETTTAGPTIYHVAKNGNDNNTGTSASPFLTINRAAAAAQPGDTILVHAGVYREWVKPSRGGISEAQRIIYQAAAGEDVAITGSEQISNWVSQGGGVWKVDLPNTYFGNFNPYALNISGGWLSYGQWHHRGDVYLNNEAYFEKQTLAEMHSTPNSWYTEVTSTTTSIWANFGTANPNSALAEINVRECVFFPDLTGLQYLTVDGFKLRQAATNWLYDQFSPTFVDVTQKGLIGPNWGKYWIIQNNIIEHSRTVGVSLGYAQGKSGVLGDINNRGWHTVRNNIIRKNGQAGIAGQWGAVVSTISDNLIEDINDRDEFGGAENAGIKLHYAIDTVIKHNLIRRVQSDQDWNHMGIWLDWGAQGTRITGNIIYDIKSTTAIAMEVDHGPILIDNNIFINNGIFEDADEAVIYAHNLFYNTSIGVTANAGDGRVTPYFYPHTSTQLGAATLVNRDDKFFNNLFVCCNSGLLDIKATSVYPGFAADWNMYLGAYATSPWGDANSVVDHFYNPNLILSESPNGVSLSFSASSPTFTVQTPLITKDLVGLVSLAQQGIENHDGSPITIDKDFFGNQRSLTHPVVGPFEKLKSGSNIFVIWSYNKIAGDANGDGVVNVSDLQYELTGWFNPFTSMDFGLTYAHL